MSENIDENAIVQQKNENKDIYTRLAVKVSLNWSYFDTLEEDKRNILKTVLDSQQYKNATTRREQVGILLSTCSRKVSSYEIADLLNLSYSQVSNDYRNYKIDIKGNRKPNGHPLIMEDNDLQLIKKWLDSFIIPPRFKEVKEFIMNHCSKVLHHTTITNVLHKLNYEVKTAEPMEDKRYFIQSQKIAYYYDTLTAFTRANRVPSALIYNLDEEGHEPFEDRREMKVVIPKDYERQVHFPVPRTGNRTTFLACICGDGHFLPPCVVTKRKTVETELLARGLTPAHLYLAESPNGFITTEIFNNWLDNVFAPAVTKTRKDIQFFGVGILLLDGFSAHISKHFFEKMYALNIQVFFLPSHSSHLTQPLDLGIFGPHKNTTILPNSALKKLSPLKDVNPELDDPQFVEAITRLYDGWQKAATVQNIQSAFKQAGVEYVLGGPSYHYVCFNAKSSRCYKEWAAKDAEDFKQDQERIAQSYNSNEQFKIQPAKKLNPKDNDKDNFIKKASKGSPLKLRIPVKEFNSQDFKSQIRSMKPVIPDIQSLSLLQRLLYAIVPMNHASKLSSENLEVTQKGRQKKTTKAISSPDPSYTELSFNDKLKMELKALELELLQEHQK